MCVLKTMRKCLESCPKAEVITCPRDGPRVRGRETRYGLRVCREQSTIYQRLSRLLMPGLLLATLSYTARRTEDRGNPLNPTHTWSSDACSGASLSYSLFST